MRPIAAGDDAGLKQGAPPPRELRSVQALRARITECRCPYVSFHIRDHKSGTRDDRETSILVEIFLAEYETDSTILAGKVKLKDRDH